MDTPRICAREGCSNPLPRKNRQFCSARCQGRVSSEQRGWYQHGFYSARIRHCEAPGCGKPFKAHRLTARFCSEPCRVQFGQWSFRVSSPTNKRVFRPTW